MTASKTQRHPNSSLCPELDSQFYLQKNSFLESEPETLSERKSHLRTLKEILIENHTEIFSAISRDFGNRSIHESLLAEYITVIGNLNSTIRNLKRWMKPERRHVELAMYAGAKNWVIPQPLGVVGVIVPWNFPVNQIFTQLASIFAAGNRAMVKMSEKSTHLSALLISIVERYFPREKLSIHAESGRTGMDFAQLPFDHLIFTGSSDTGRKVMASASANLTPVTLELGGKCPAIIATDYPLKKAVERILFAKQFNGGQICTSVDYVFVHHSKLQEFITLSRSWVEKSIPDINSTDYTSIIDQAAFTRIEETVKDAKDKGARILPLTAQSPNALSRKYPLTLILDTTEDMIIRRKETFGPLLMVLPYDTPQEVVGYINRRDRPLAIYPFSNDKQLTQRYIGQIMSGGVTVNDALYHVGQHDLPFGGVGASGMGHYHGREGFLNFSKLRPIMEQASITAGGLLSPPYSTGPADKILRFLSQFLAR